MCSVNFNPESGKTSGSSGSGQTGETSYNNGSLINRRANFEGPCEDTLTRSGSSDKESVPGGVRKFLVGLLKPLLGARSSTIEFLDQPVKVNDDMYILSEPFKADNLEDAANSAKKQYAVQKGSIQRQTGEIFMGIDARETADGKFEVTADGIM